MEASRAKETIQIILRPLKYFLKLFYIFQVHMYTAEKNHIRKLHVFASFL